MEDQDDRPSPADHAPSPARDAERSTVMGAARGADGSAERYELRWPGKAAALRLAALPPTGTLTPVARQSIAPRGDALADAEARDAEARDAHLLIEGDNLEALKLLLPDYRGRIPLIYIDPPYNTGNSFIFADTYADSPRAYRQRTGDTGARVSEQ